MHMNLGMKNRSRLTNCAVIRIATLHLCLGLLLALLGSLASQAQAETRMVEYEEGAFVEISPNQWIEVKKGDAIWGLTLLFLK